MPLNRKKMSFRQYQLSNILQLPKMATIQTNATIIVWWLIVYLSSMLQKSDVLMYR